MNERSVKYSTIHFREVQPPISVTGHWRILSYVMRSSDLVVAGVAMRREGRRRRRRERRRLLLIMLRRGGLLRD